MAVTLHASPAPGSVVIVAVDGAATDLAGLLMQPRTARFRVRRGGSRRSRSPPPGRSSSLERSTWSIPSILVKRSTGCDSFIGPAVAGTCRLGRPVSTTSRVPVGALTAVAWTELDLAGHWIARFATTWEAFQAATGKYPNRSTSHDAHDLAVGVEDASTDPRLVMAWPQHDGPGARPSSSAAWRAQGGPRWTAISPTERLRTWRWRWSMDKGQWSPGGSRPLAGSAGFSFGGGWAPRGGASRGRWSATGGRSPGAATEGRSLWRAGHALVESSGGADRTFVGTWDGAAWHLTSLDGAKRPDLTFEPSGRLVLGYVDGGTEQVRAAALEGGAGIDLGHPDDSAPVGAGETPQVTVTWDGDLSLAWKDAAGSIRLIRRSNR